MPGKPAARITDPTTHGSPLLPGPGSPNVLIGFLPAWRTLIDFHACPVVKGVVPDVGGVVMLGSPTVWTNFQMQCRVMDQVIEIPGGPNPIAMGCPTVLIGEAGAGAGVAPPAPAAAMGQGGAAQRSPGGPAGAGPTGDKGKLLGNPHVKAGLKAAAGASDIAGKNPTEQGGFILKDPKTGDLSVERWPQGQGASIQPVMSADGLHNGKEIVGSFHTHPNVGPGWKQEPSTADINFVKKYPKTAGTDHFVISKDKTYHIDNAGTVAEIGSTQDLLK